MSWSRFASNIRAMIPFFSPVRPERLVLRRRTWGAGCLLLCALALTSLLQGQSPSPMVSALVAQTKPRARQLGVPFGGTPGPLDAITDVAGVEVGHVTLIEGNGRLVPGKGPVRTGVTAI